MLRLFYFIFLIATSSSRKSLLEKVCRTTVEVKNLLTPISIELKVIATKNENADYYDDHDLH